MICKKCLVDKDSSNFRWMSDGRFYSYCKDCHKINQAIWRKTEKGKKSALASKKGNKKYRFRERILKKYGCRSCGEQDIKVLEFDHIDPATKVEKISKMVKRCATMKDIKNEMRKCQVLCFNCHIKKTKDNKEFLQKGHKPSKN